MNLLLLLKIGKLMVKKWDPENCNEGLCEDSNKSQKFEHPNFPWASTGPSLCEETGLPLFEEPIMTSAVDSPFKGIHISISLPPPPHRLYYLSLNQAQN